MDATTAAIALIKAAGFVEDGQTATQHVRIPTVQNPVYGGIGGKPATFGGRQRFVRPGTTIKVTVGARTVNFYRVGPIPIIGRPVIYDLGSAKTKDTTQITDIIASLPK